LKQSRAEDITLVQLVSEQYRSEWESFSVDRQGWVQDGIDYRGEDQDAQDITPYIHVEVYDHDADHDEEIETDHQDEHLGRDEEDHGLYHNENGRLDEDNDNLPYRDAGSAELRYAVYWQVAPAPVEPGRVNFNFFSQAPFSDSFEWMEMNRLPVFTETLSKHFDHHHEPHSLLLQPVTENFDGTSTLVGSLVTTVGWALFFSDVLPEHVKDLILVLSNTCGGAFTFQINGPHAVYLGEGDLHDLNYKGLESPLLVRKSTSSTTLPPPPPCTFKIAVYPSKVLRLH
jgi:hypothetical protein